MSWQRFPIWQRLKMDNRPSFTINKAQQHSTNVLPTAKHKSSALHCSGWRAACWLFLLDVVQCHRVWVFFFKLLLSFYCVGVFFYLDQKLTLQAVHVLGLWVFIWTSTQATKLKTSKSNATRVTYALVLLELTVWGNWSCFLLAQSLSQSRLSLWLTHTYTRRLHSKNISLCCACNKHEGLFISVFPKVVFGRKLRLITASLHWRPVCIPSAQPADVCCSRKLRNRADMGDDDREGVGDRNESSAATVPFGHIFFFFWWARHSTMADHLTPPTKNTSRKRTITRQWGMCGMSLRW